MAKPTIPDLYKIDLDDPQAQPFILQLTQRMARYLWGAATAYRLGQLSRLTGLVNPYDNDRHNHKLFEIGRAEVGLHGLRVQI